MYEYATRQHKRNFASVSNQTVRVQTRTEIPDGEGGYTYTWADTTSVTIWASVTCLNSKQRAEYASLKVDATHEVDISAYIAISEDDRIIFDGRIFEVLTIGPPLSDKGRYERRLLCKERIDHGQQG